MRSVLICMSLQTLSCAALQSPEPTPGPLHALMDFEAGRFGSSPYPSVHFQNDEAVDLAVLPTPGGNPIVNGVFRALADVDGFGTTSAIYFPLSAAVVSSNLSIPEGDGPYWLVNVDVGSTEYGRRHPVDVFFDAAGTRFSAPNLLSMIPRHGQPLSEGTLYAALVERRALGTQAAESESSSEVDETIARCTSTCSAADQSLADAAQWFLAHGVELTDILGMTVFRTGHPSESLVRHAAELASLRYAASSEPVFTERFSNYCVAHGVFDIHSYQSGEPPFSSSGGAFASESGRLVTTRVEAANAWFTIPTSPMPAGGYPVAVVVRAGAGADRAAIDRGPVTTQPSAPGTGIAETFAAAGYATISVDGPHGGLRNITSGDEQFLVFNIQNPVALRDNVRQSALELFVLGNMLAELSLDLAGSCSETMVDDVTFNTDNVVLLGHSTGATIAPLAAAIQPVFRHLVLSGAGGNWAANILFKQRPIATRSFAQSLLGYGSHMLTFSDVPLNLLQWAGESADPPIYATRVRQSAGHIYVFQGVVDRYILPPIAAPLIVGLGLDQGGPSFDGTGELSAFAPMSQTISEYGQTVLDTVSLNQMTSTGLVSRAYVQYPEDGIQDGHEVLWQRPETREHLGCFLSSLTTTANIGNCPNG